MPDASSRSQWIRLEAVAAGNAPEVLARRERLEARALDETPQRMTRHRDRSDPLSFWCSPRARQREPIA
jgi:hypothetical protein